MSTVKDRLIQEKADLNEKIEKLESFIASDKFQDIYPTQMSLLNIQIFAMRTYSQVLVERIAHLSGVEVVLQ